MTSNQEYEEVPHVKDNTDRLDESTRILRIALILLLSKHLDLLLHDKLK